ncbi:RsmB/NOP family class I SAM-dependent RNA methyltransferase [Candidatus Bathyarchaeota archaeon]|nr:RsmB/NOP family class I SAM-dependent RNA methyltransferase [Candidatus Bathyarchaeota archaeon]
MIKKAWALAIETLSLVELKRLGERLALTKTTKKLGIKDPKTIGLAHKLVSETIRKMNYIDFLLNNVLAPKSLKEIKCGPRIFLRLYTHETKLSDGNLNKASRIVRMGRSILGWRKLNDIEEILGKLLSIKPESLMKKLNEFEKIALQTYNPTWFVKYCFKLLGRKEALKFLEKSTEITPTYIRLNTLKSHKKTILKHLDDDKIILKKVPQLKHTYKLIETRKPLTRTQSFIEGLFYIQDKASCLAAEIADPKQGNIVLDVCAAPGSKTTYIAQLMKDKGKIFSIDYSKRRIRILKRETKHMGIENVQIVVADARKSLPLKILADLVILDPPCTSTGTFGKTPDAKWRITKRSMLGMSKIQSEMIDHGTEFVKNGGFLIYSTCSITLEENEMVIEKFLKLHPEFKLVDTTPRIGLPGLRGLTQCQRLYPHIHGCNGFFIAKLKKEE